MSEYKIAIYIRLSMADEETGKSKDESNSIVNQRSLIHRFLDEHEELSSYSRTEFVDDGFSGTNTCRPAFQDMVTQIREGRYNLCITKDFSRFSRDYIEMGDYLECLFPFLKVRYISINDRYDSEDYKGTTGGLDVVMRAIVYDAYSKDLSAKVSSGMRQSRKKGRRTSGQPAFGYKCDPQRRSMDVIDPEAATIVRRIFDAAIEGMRVGEIAKLLNKEGVITPAVYFRKRNPNSEKFGNTSDRSRWTYNEVYQILKRYCYTGASVGGMRKKLIPCKSQSVQVDFEDWIIVPDMHEAIVTVEEYKLAQKVISSTKRENYQVTEYPLKSLVYCGNCGRRLVRHQKTTRYYCPYGRHDGDDVCRQVHTEREDDLIKQVFPLIKKCINAEKQHENDLKKLITTKSENMGTERIAECRKRIDLLRAEKLREYEKYGEDRISKDDYITRKSRIDCKISDEEEKIRRMEEEIKDMWNMKSGVHLERQAVCESFSEKSELMYDMAHAFIERVIAYPDERIEVKLKFGEIM